MADLSDRLLIARGENDRLFDEAGRSYIDLFTAHGTAWLGHANPVVAEAISDQLRKVWNTGAISTRIREQAQAAVESLLPPSHRLAGFYSTGMEAAECALRTARVSTGRSRIVGFEHAMHGKSLATAALAWDNAWNLRTADLVRLPFVDQLSEDDVLSSLVAQLLSLDVAAVCVEPMLGSHGGFQASADFYRALHQLCGECGTHLVFDEILTGFWRTAAPFFFTDLGFTPDIVLVGKALGAGFPVSGVVVDRRIAVDSRMLPGSTFAGNPMAAAAVVASLAEMARLDLPARVAAIGEVIERRLSPLRRFGLALRGCGALWVLEVSGDLDMPRLLADVYRGGVAIGSAARFVRLLPAATISPENLEQACGVLCDAVKTQVAEQAAKA